MLYSLSGFLFEDGYTSQSISVREFCQTARTLGYQGVELRRTQVTTDTPQQERKAMMEILQDSGLTVTCLTARGIPPGGGDREAFFMRCLDLCADLGCALLKIGGDVPWLQGAAGVAHGRGVVLATNNHVGSDLESVEGSRRYFRDIDHRNMGLLFDCHHLFAAGEDYVSAATEFLPFIRNVLVQTTRCGPGGDGSHCLPDDAGAQDWPAVMDALMKGGYDGLITVIENGWPPEQRVEIARHNIEYLRELESR